MLPSSRPLEPTDHASNNGNTAPRLSAATNENSSPAFVACFVLPPKQAEILISVLKEFVSGSCELFSLGNGPTRRFDRRMADPS
jgi:hypothetical protein